MVDLAAVHLVTGVAGLHELHLRAEGVRIGVVDAQMCDPLNEAYLDEALVIRPRRRRRDGDRTHGDDMLDLLRDTAPRARVVLAEVAETDGLVYRRPVAEGLRAIEGRGLGVVLVSLEFRRLPERCSPEDPCEACTAARRMAESTIVVVAAGNTGELGYTCPAAGAGQALVVVASEGPPDSDAPPGAGQSGTSVSAALTAGGVALLLEAFPDLGPQELRAALFATPTRLGDGSARFHLFRAYRHIEHTRRGGTADEARAQAVVDEHGAILADARAGATDGREALGVLDRALGFAPWSAELNGWRAAIVSGPAPGDGLTGIAEAIRLDWQKPWLHRELARQLDSLGLFGAGVERAVAGHLEAGETGRALRALQDGLANPRVAD